MKNATVDWLISGVVILTVFIGNHGAPQQGYPFTNQ